MRQLAFPGEEPESVKPPEAVAEFILQRLSSDWRRPASWSAPTPDCAEPRFPYARANFTAGSERVSFPFGGGD